MTSLVYGERVRKDDPRVEAYGTCDEANSMIGFAASLLRKEDFLGKESLMKSLERIQTMLFHVGSYLSTPGGKEVKWPLKEEEIRNLEREIDELNGRLEPLQNFILPGGHQAGAALHVARTVVRRAERLTVKMGNNDGIVLKYLNRLSDWLFVAARFVNHSLGMEETKLHEGKK